MLKCRKCGLNDVDGRKETICKQCKKREEISRANKDKIERMEREMIEKAVDLIVKPSDVLSLFWRESNNNMRSLIQGAVSFKLLESNPYNDNLGEDLLSIMSDTNMKREFLWALSRRVEHFVDDWYRKIIEAQEKFVVKERKARR